MASNGIVSFLLISSFMIDAMIAGKFVEITCQKSAFEAEFGTNTLLDCGIKTSKNDAKIELVTWTLNKTLVLTFIDGELRPMHPSFQFAKTIWDRSNRNVSLLITNTNFSHSGDYRCDVMTDTGHAFKEVNLTVKAHYSKPIIVSDPEEIDRDKDFTLTCSAHGGFPKGHLRWVVDGFKYAKKSEDQVDNSSGLYSLTNKLHFGPNSMFTTFVCEVHNASRLLESQSTPLEILPSSHSKGSDTSSKMNEHSVSHIVAPVVVIGSLIVGLLVAVLVMCRRKHQNVEMAMYPEEKNEMV